MKERERDRERERGSTHPRQTETYHHWKDDETKKQQARGLILGVSAEGDEWVDAGGRHEETRGETQTANGLAFRQHLREIEREREKKKHRERYKKRERETQREIEREREIKRERDIYI